MGREIGREELERKADLEIEPVDLKLVRVDQVRAEAATDICAQKLIVTDLKRV